ncbi:MAG: DUF2232 domain-containing protein [Candidatus Humimicrobiaceae bacterium]
MSFDNLNRIKTKKLNLGLLILFTFLALVFSFFVPGIGLLGVALLPVPSVLLMIMGRIRDGIICATIACLVILAVNYILAPVAIILIVSVAFIYRWAVENNKDYWQVIGAVFFTFFAAIMLYIILFSAFYRVNFFSEALGVYNEYVDNLMDDSFVDAYSSLMVLDRSQMSEVIAQTQGMLRFIPKILPGILVASFGIVSVLNHVFSVKIFKRYQIELKPMVPFIRWDLPWYYVWGIIIGLVLVLVPEMGSSIDGGSLTVNTVADIIGYNLIIIFGLLYLLLGISVLFGIFARFKMGIIWKVLIFASLWFFFALALIVFPLLGLIDIWANFRKIKRK